MHRRCAIVGAALSIAAASRAGASEPIRPTFQLVYDAPSTCPGRDELVEQIAARVGYAPVDDESDANVSVRITTGNDGVHATLLVLEPTAVGPKATESPRAVRRSFTGKDCREVVHSIALTLAFYIDPIMTPHPPPAAEPAPVATAPDPHDVPPPPHVEPPRPRSEPSRFAVAAAIAGGVGLLPRPFFGPRIAFLWEPPKARFAIEGAANVALGTRETSGVDLSASLVGGSVVACLRLASVFGCVDFLVGRYEATAIVPGREHSAAKLFLMPGARLGAQWKPTASLRLDAWAFVGAPLTPIALDVADQTVWHSAPINAGLAVGGAWIP